MFRRLSKRDHGVGHANDSFIESKETPTRQESGVDRIGVKYRSLAGGQRVLTRSPIVGIHAGRWICSIDPLHFQWERRPGGNPVKGPQPLAEFPLAMQPSMNRNESHGKFKRAGPMTTIRGRYRWLQGSAVVGMHAESKRLFFHSSRPNRIEIVDYV